MDPVKKRWMYTNWIEDQNETHELAKNHAYLMGWFYNPELVNKITGSDTEVHVSTDQDFEKSLEIVKNTQASEERVERKKRKRQRKIKDN